MILSHLLTSVFPFYFYSLIFLFIGLTNVLEIIGNSFILSLSKSFGARPWLDAQEWALGLACASWSPLDVQ